MRAWRWIFGLALVPAALIVWADADDVAGAPLWEHVLAAVLAYGLGVACAALAAGIGWAGLLAARSALDFIADLFHPEA